MYISYEIRTKFVWSSCEVHMNRKFLLHMYFKWSSCELHMKFICNYVWNIEVAMIFICISFEVHMTHRPELSNEISYEWYEPSVVGIAPNVFNDYFTGDSSIHDYNTRLGEGFHVPKIGNDCGKWTLQYNGCLLWNKIILLNFNFDICSLASFKHQIRYNLSSL